MPQDHASHDLAVRGLGVQNAPGGDSIDDAGDADDAEFLVNLYLGEDGGMRIAGVLPNVFEIGRAFRFAAFFP